MSIDIQSQITDVHNTYCIPCSSTKTMSIGSGIGQLIDVAISIISTLLIFGSGYFLGVVSVLATGGALTGLFRYCRTRLTSSVSMVKLGTIVGTDLMGWWMKPQVYGMGVKPVPFQWPGPVNGGQDIPMDVPMAIPVENNLRRRSPSPVVVNPIRPVAQYVANDENMTMTANVEGLPTMML